MRAIATVVLSGVIMTLGGIPASVEAEEERSPHARRADPSRTVTLPARALSFREGVRLAEGPRMLRDTFPYLVALEEEANVERGLAIRPETLPALLAEGPPIGGSSPVRIPSARAAIDAVRLFVAGPLVTDAETAERIVDTGGRLAEGLRYLDVQVTEHRPDAWSPRATPVAALDKAAGTIARWDVSLVAFELDRRLRLVHVTAAVKPDGTIELEQTPIVDGPMTTWQTAVLGEYTEAMEQEQRAMVAEVDVARRAYAEALRPARTIGAFWPVVRVLHRMDDVRALFGAPDRDVGSGIHIWVYDLDDGTQVALGGSEDRIVYARHVRGATKPLAGFETLGILYR